MRFKRSIPYQILIDPTPNSGFIVTVGCAKLAYVGYTQLIRDLTAYFENPEDFEKQYNHDIAKLDRVHIGPFAPALRSILPQEPVVYSQKEERVMKEMEVFRIEKLECRSNGRFSVHDFKSIINKTQDLTVLEYEEQEDKNVFLFTVKRELEWFPDTIK